MSSISAPQGWRASLTARDGAASGARPAQPDRRRPRRQPGQAGRRLRSRRGGGLRHRRLSRVVDHRVPARGPRPETRLRRRQPRCAVQARIADRPVRGDRRVRRPGPRPLQRGGDLRQRRDPRPLPQAPVAQLDGLRRGPLLHPWTRLRPARAVRDRRRQGRRLDLRGHLEPVRSGRRAGRGGSRDQHQHQRLAVPRRQVGRTRAHARHPGDRFTHGDRVRQPGRRPGRVGVRRRLGRVRPRGPAARPLCAVRRPTCSSSTCPCRPSTASACSTRAAD
jgi:hypothetical protein